MPRRRPFRRPVASPAAALNPGRACSPANSPASLTRAAGAASRTLLHGYGIEMLEQRVMLTVLGNNGPLTATGPGSGQAEFFNFSGGQIRISWNDALFQVIDATVGTGSDTAVESDPVILSATAPMLVPNIFRIDVMQSSLDSWISIAASPSLTAMGDRAVIPFGGAPTINVVDSGIPTSGALIAAPIGTNVGSVLLGAVTTTTTDAGLPILSMSNGNLTDDPINPGGTIVPGVYMSPVALNAAGATITNTAGLDTPNDLGRFFFGGVITGAVNVPAPTPGSVPPAPASQGGNVGVFYAGSILTGDATGGLGGISSLGAPSLYNVPNFTVGGDIRDLITSGGIGGGRGAAVRADVAQYSTGFRLVVAGTIGEISERTGGFYGSVDAEHLPSIYGLPNNLFNEHEIEAVDQFTTPEPGAYFGSVEGDPTGDQTPYLASLTGYPLLASDSFDNNVTPDATGVSSEGNAQYLDSIKETNANGLPVTDANGNDVYYDAVDGVVEGDAPHSEQVDNYAVSLLAGQTITPTLTLTGSGQFNGLTLDLIDPDGRVVASETVQSTAQQLSGASTTPFQYKADRPGVYAFRISLVSTAGVLTDVFYSLIVTGVGDLGLGTLITGNNGTGTVQTTDIIDTGLADSFEVDHADLGALIAPPGASVASNDQVESANTGTIDVAAGSLRIVKGGQLGVSIPDNGGGVFAPNGPFGSNQEFGSEPVINVPAGQVGLLEGLDPTGFTSVLTPFDPNNAANVLSEAFVVPTTPIGGNIQMIDGAGYVFLDLATNQGIGDILAGRMDATTASFVDVNADNAGNDGIIDLINVAGDFGTAMTGGPAFLTNTGGYIQFLRVGGAIYQDSFFGNINSSTIIGAAGQTLSYTEDTGATVTFTPVGTLTTTTTTTTAPAGTTGTAATPTTQTTTTGPAITLTTYGIRDKGGGVIVSADVTGGTMTISANGGSAAGGVADVSEITMTSTSLTTITDQTNAGGQVVLNANGEPVLVATPAAATTNSSTTSSTTGTGGDTVTTTSTVTGNNSTSSLLLTGKTTLDLLNLNVVGLMDSIVNNTPGGEIGSINSVGGIVSLSSAGTIGLLDSHNGVVLTTSNGNGTASLFGDSSTFPFDLQTTGIEVTGDLLNVRAAYGLGNIEVSGSINSLVADSSGKTIAGGFAGINAPVVVGGSVAVQAPSSLAGNNVVYATDGNILSLNIGQGVLASGTGTFSRSGVYAAGDIGAVVNNGQAGSDIRGTVIAEDKLDSLRLTNASIINAFVGSVFPASGTQGGALTVIGLNPGVNPTNFNVGSIVIAGRGGIIGSTIGGYAVNRVSVSAQGFGILTSIFQSSGGGVINSITAGGYGIRDSSFVGGASINSINATGNGSQLPVTDFGADLRQSDTTNYDRYSGQSLTADNDLNAALGTSPGVAIIPASTDTGVLEDDSVLSTGTIGAVSAQTIRTALPLTSLIQAEPQANIPRVGQTFPMELNTISKLGSVNIRGTINGLQITAGSLGTFHEHGGVSRLGISVAGTIQNLTITGNFGQLITDPGSGATIPDSYIQATGPAGTIRNLTIDGNLNGTVTANVAIQKMTVLGNVVGSITALGQTTGQTLGTLRIAGALKDGSLTIDGPAGSIIANAGLGDSTGTLTVNGSLQELEVGAAHARGSTLASAVDVTGTLGKLIVNGSITGALTVGGDITTAKVTGDGSNPNIVTAPINVGGRIYTATFADGNLAANITANGFIRNFTVRDGDVLASSTISSQLDSIQNFTITGGTGFGLFGNLSAINGSGGSVDLSGNLGDGTDAASIIEGSGKRFHIRGSVLGNTRIAISGALDLLEVDGNIAAGAVVSAHPLTKLVVRGTNGGNVTQS